MKIIIFVAVIVGSLAAPHQRYVLPRLPLRVMEKGNLPWIASDKIVGGTEVAPNSLPFQVSLQRRDLAGTYSQACSGSILDASTIIDAAHCVDGAIISNLRIVAGEHSLSVVSGLEQNRNVSGVIIHPIWDDYTYEGDISLIFLSEPLDLSVPSAKPVVLPPPTAEYEPPVGTIVTVSGWGATVVGGSISDTLRSVDIPVISDSDCDQAYQGNVTNPAVFSSMLCAGDTTSARINYCEGDSGGPLFTGSGETAVLHGIVSWGQGCIEGGKPGVYTQVSYFLDWIAANRNGTGNKSL